ncbi:hypothetical protein B0H15DRAFT_933516 [Mycena belliarum]|uniref:Uncharacterized protein n=1 Tax=Mycena belliarum TaxID=1033014 RepID=A0AAD6XJP1_9AGAR|nr:hypothetical protein B0H15DRAFT_933516 [Mycena belliae]
MQGPAFLALAALALKALGSPTTSDIGANSPQIHSGIVSVAEMKAWLASSAANLTFVGEPVEHVGLTPFTTTVTYCSTRTANLCSGPCTVYTGGAKCLNAPHTNCLTATSNVAFCNRAGCGGSCNVLSSCGTHLDSGFCYTPGTNSISVPPS